jgi:hypothetical protein
MTPTPATRLMLRINEVMGLEKQPVWLTLQKDLGPA